MQISHVSTGAGCVAFKSTDFEGTEKALLTKKVFY